MKTQTTYSESKLDKIDCQILEKLQKNATISKKQLSKEIDLTPSSTIGRVKKLEKLGIIKDYHTELNPQKLGFGIQSLVQVTLTSLNEKNIHRFRNEIEDISEVLECYHVTGSANLILKVISENIATFEHLIVEKIADLEYVSKVDSRIILSTIKNSKFIPIPKNV